MRPKPIEMFYCCRVIQARWVHHSRPKYVCDAIHLAKWMNASTVSMRYRAPDRTHNDPSTKPTCEYRIYKFRWEFISDARNWIMMHNYHLFSHHNHLIVSCHVALPVMQSCASDSHPHECPDHVHNRIREFSANRNKRVMISSKSKPIQAESVPHTYRLCFVVPNM